MGYSGFAVMTYEYQFFVVSDSDRDKDDIRVKAMANLPCKKTSHLSLPYMCIYCIYNLYTFSVTVSLSHLSVSVCLLSLCLHFCLYLPLSLSPSDH